MIDEHQILDRAVQILEPYSPELEETLRRRDRRRREQRLKAGFVAIVIVVVGVGLFLRSERSAEKVPADRSITIEDVATLGLDWTGSAPGDGRFASIRSADGMVFATSFQGRSGTLLAFPQACATTCEPTWRADVGCCENMPDGPLVLDGMVFIAEGNTLFAFDERCGRGGASCAPVWRGVVPGAALYQPVGASGVVYVGSSDGRLYAWSDRCADGDAVCLPLWASRSQHDPLQPSTVVDGHVYVGSLDTDRASRDNGVYAFPAVCSNGCEPIAKAYLPLDLASRPAVSGDAAFIANSDSQGGKSEAIAYPRRCAFEAHCRPLWTATLPGRSNMPDPIVSGDVVFFGSTAEGSVRAFPVTCENPCPPLWTAFAFDPSLNAPAAAEGLFYLPSTTQGLQIFPVECPDHAGVCDPIWRSTEMGYGSVSGVAVDDGRVFIRTTDGRLIALAPSDAPSGKE